mmetsp:Transcript_19452/g.58777  ORF Transcript_19452/g.58777 Transcript_19452/m.58777 type:complete len:107 (-) Transcript_19452:2453-2773(-)
MRCWSWLTMRTPPWNKASPSMSACTASMSKWLDGSSSSRMWGLVHVTLARATRDFCPPDNVNMGCMHSSPPMPKLPKCARCSSSLTLGNDRIMHCSGVSARSSPST